MLTAISSSVTSMTRSISKHKRSILDGDVDLGRTLMPATITELMMRVALRPRRWYGEKCKLGTFQRIQRALQHRRILTMMMTRGRRKLRKRTML